MAKWQGMTRAQVEAWVCKQSAQDVDADIASQPGNQCDGCACKMPTSNGTHMHKDRPYQVCQAKKYNP